MDKVIFSGSNPLFNTQEPHYIIVYRIHGGVLAL